MNRPHRRFTTIVLAGALLAPALPGTAEGVATAIVGVGYYPRP